MLNNQYIHILELAECNFTCDLISSNLDFANCVFDVVSNDSSILESAIRNNFSQIPLCDGKDNSKRISEVACIDLVNKTILRRDKVQIDEIITSTTPLQEIPDLLTKRPFYFVMEGDAIKKIITIADINNLPMKTYLLILLSHFDYMVTEYIRHKWIDEEWLPLLPESSQKQIAREYKQRILSSLDTSKIDCASFQSKIEIVSKDKMIQPHSKELSEVFLKNCVHYVQTVYKRISSHESLIGESEEISGKEIGKQLSELSSVITAVHGWIDEMDRILTDGNDA